MERERYREGKEQLMIQKYQIMCFNMGMCGCQWNRVTDVY